MPADGIPVQLEDCPPRDQAPAEEFRRRFAPGGYGEVTTASTWIVRLALTGATLVYMLVVARWGWNFAQEDHAGAAEPQVQLASETAPSGELRMWPLTTGIVVVDEAVSGFLKGNVDEAFSHLLLRQVRCGTVPSGGAPALGCLAGEEPGTVHELILSACEARWVTGEVALAELATLLANAPGLYAVSQVRGGYTAVLTWPGALDRSLVLEVSSVGVASYGAGCGLPLAPAAGRELAFVAAPGH